TEANFAGILTPQHLILGILNDWSPAKGEELEEAFLKSAKDHLSKTIAEVLPKDQPTVAPEAKLARLIKLAGSSEYECIPVVEEGRVEGLVYTTDIFQAAAQLVLTDQGDGISLRG
ncbi:MAG: CBS domain-containing protein, partial [Verrucomicrobiota bacterium]